MDYLSVMQSGVLGNLAYDLLKLGVSLTFDNLTKGLKAKGQQWLLDEQATAKITDRVAKLYHDEHSQAQFNQALTNDTELVELLKDANQTSININKNTQTVSDSPQSSNVAGNVEKMEVHHHYSATGNSTSVEDSTQKKP